MAKAMSAEAKKKAFIAQAKKKKLDWRKSRMAKPGEGFDKPVIDDGIYNVRVTGEFDVGVKGKLAGLSIVRLCGTVVGSEFEGVKVSQMYTNKDSDTAGYLVGDLKRLFPDQVAELEATDEFADLVPYIEALNENPPLMEAKIENSSDEKYVNLRLRDPVPEDGETASEETETEETEVEEEVEETEEAVDDGEYEPAKDDPVKARIKGRNVEGTVMTVNRTTKTVTLKNTKTGTKFANVAWDKLEYTGE